MSIRNKVQLVGRLGQEVDYKTFANDGKLARFSVATNEAYRDKNGEWQEETTWHRLVAWGSVAERVAKQLQKGNMVLIEGKLVNNEFTDSNGIKRYTTEVQVETFMLLEKREQYAMATVEDRGGHSKEDAYKSSADETELPF
ncbi:MAG: single-stranded DNA-binding protein [Weeksellaceae bacterium]|nr:single-stranded DNA-binding protein [Weeksellaceae bacterium]